MKSMTNGIMNYALIVPMLMTAGTVLMSSTFLQTSTDSVDYTDGIDIEKFIEINTTTKDNIEKVSVQTISEQAIPEKTPIVDVSKPDMIPTGIIYPKPKNIPLLREYDINKDSNVKIWHAHNAETYIIPNDEWVKHVASQLYVDDTGRIKYKNMPIPAYQDIDGNILSWTNEPFLNNYTTDDELFNYPANADLWQNADYYLSHGMKGDCEDWAIAVTSMMLSGEMSIKENGVYLRQVIPAKVVMGRSGKNLDSWIEFKVYGNIYISSTGKEFNPSIGKEQSITTFHQKNDDDGFNPFYQFTDEYFGRYNNNT